VIISIEAATAGDLVFEHGSGLISWLIRWAEKIRFRGSEWNHVAILSDQDPDGSWWVIQAQGNGVHRVKFDESVVHSIVRPPAGVDRAPMMEFARCKDGARYGFISCLSIFINLFTPAFIRIDFRTDGTLICSALATQALLAGGVHNVFPFRDLYGVTPAQLWDVLTEAP